MLGFSVLFGCAVIAEQAPSSFAALAIGSGVLLLAREIIKDGWEWLRCLKGIITIFKVGMLAIGTYFLPIEGLLDIVMLCGLMTSHLPKEIKDRKLI